MKPTPIVWLTARCRQPDARIRTTGKTYTSKAARQEKTLAVLCRQTPVPPITGLTGHTRLALPNGTAHLTAVAQVPLDCPSGYACDNGACKIMSCTPGTKCIDGNTKGYQDSSCVWSSISDCESPYSCVNGACVSTCFDSDKDIANPSFTKGYCADQTGNYTDYCVSATQARDYYCGGTWTGGQWVNVSCKAGGYSCANGCANGACIP